MRASILAWSIAVFGIALYALYYVLDVLNGHRIAPPIIGVLLGIAFLGVGALVASRRQRNPIGWIYLAGMTLVGYGGYANFADQYAYYAVITRPGSLPAPEIVAALSRPVLLLGFSALLILPLLFFPDGLPSRRWRPVAIVGGVTVVAQAVLQLLAPGPLSFSGSAVRSSAELQLLNPFGLAGLGGVAADLVNLLNLPLIAVVLASVAAPVVRYRRAAGPERQQLKWFAFGTAWIGVVVLVASALSVFAPSVMDVVAADLWPLSVIGIPIATAIGILRYRLYDIDIVIERTLVYGATSALIASVFFGAIVVLQAVLRPLTGGSEIAVAVSTLASIALFTPLRRRTQSAVDHRFYRSRYDAVRTLDAFSARLRDEVDLDAVSVELLESLDRTVRPASASLWLRPPTIERR